MKGRKLIPFVLIAAGLLAYLNSFSGSYFHDDFQAILDNPTVRQLWPIWSVLAPLRGSTSPVAGRPLINLSLAVNYAISGYNVWSYHLVNLIVHVLAGLTLFGIVRRTLLQARLRERFGAAASELALAAAVLWTLHPLQTESVTYIVQRAESIMGLFYLLTLYCFIRGTESPRARLWYGLSATVCALGMASKQVMVSAPLTVLLYDRAFLSGSFRQAWRQRWPVYLALSATWIVLIVTMVSAGFYTAHTKLNEAHHLNRWTYLLTESEVIVNYLRWSVWPYRLPLMVNTFQPGNVILPGTAVLLLLGASAWALRKNSGWGFLGAWFFMILAPTSSFLPSIDPIFIHRMYLPLAAVVSLIVIGLYVELGRLGLTVALSVATVLGVFTWRENQVFRRDPHYNMGLALAATGRLQEAIKEFDQALRVTPDDPWSHYNLALALSQAGNVPEAMAHYEQALRLQPDFAEAHYNLGILLKDQGQLPQAIAHWEQTLRLRPDYVEAHYNLGVALDRMGRVPEAIRHYEQALQADSNYAQAHGGLGVALAQLGRTTEAVGHWEQALRIKPDYAEAHKNLGAALEHAGRMQEAMEHYQQALQLKPDYAEAHYSLGVALTRLDKVTVATEHWEQALRIKPDYAEAHYNLGVALERAGRVQEAIGHYEQAARLKPDFAEAQNSLARLRGAQH